MNKAFCSALKLVLCILMCTFFASSLDAQQQIQEGAQTLKAQFRGKTRPLSDLAPMPGTPASKRSMRKANKPDFMPPNFINYRKQPKVNLDALPHGEDPVRQSDFYRSLLNVVEPNVIIEGIHESDADAGVPDTNGDVGPDHYVQIVNASWFQIFAKDGTALTEPTSANTIWSEIGMQSFSDPLILYDEEAERWLLTDLANINVVLYGVSETADPMGAWNLYTLTTPGFADYPKYGVWPNAYLFTINEGQGSYPVYALNRQQMLSGASTVDVQRIEIPGISGGFPTATPMDWNSPTPPPTDEIFVVRINDDAWGNGNSEDLLEVWTINLDWDNANNTSTSSLQLATAPYDSDGCSVNNSAFACIPQPGTAQGIDGIMTIVMHNVAYWNYGTHESAALTFSVDAGSDVAGIRWMELRRLPGEDWSVYQEGTFAPDDGTHRFIGGIAINSKGDIGLAYSVSSENTFPSLRFTGRRASDPLGEMTIEEYEFATGEGVRSGDRYGDYAKMSVDPIDDSFWFTSEYVHANGSYGTKIVNFTLTRDTFDIAPTALLSPQNAPDLTANESVSIQIRNTGLAPATEVSVGYIFEGQAAVVEPAAIDTLFPDSSYMHTFVPTVDMSTVGAYEFKVFTVFAEDQNIANDTLRRVRQNLPRLDAGVTNIEGLDGILCESPAVITVFFTNFGTDVLESITIEYQVNGGVTQTVDWTGSLASGEVGSVTISVEPLMNGTNTILVETSMPNNLPDEITENDSYERSFNVLLDGVDVSLELNLDNYPEETSWQLADEAGNVLFTGGTYPGQLGATINANWCLDTAQCYTFTIFDSYGDGLAEGNGSYSISDSEGNVLASIINVNFGSEEMNEFCLTAPCNLAVEFDVTPESSQGNSDGAILITVSAGASPFTYSIDGGASSQSEPLFDNLSGGTYDVVVTDANNCTFEEEVTVGTLVDVDEILSLYDVTVYPNPSENGAFWLKVEGLSSQKPIELQVLDALGQPVSYQQLAPLNSYHKGMVSLANYPAGVYYIRFLDKSMNELIKVVRL